MATATAINSLYFTGIAPSATAILSKAQKAFITSGARLSIFFNLARFALLYIRLIALFQEAVFKGTKIKPALALFGRYGPDGFGKLCMQVRVHRTMFYLGAHRIGAEIVVVFP